MVTKTETHTIHCGERTLTYLLTRKSVKNVNLRIKPDGQILVSAHRGVPVSFIDDFIRRKQDYIFAVLDKYEEKRKKEEGGKRQYSGEECAPVFEAICIETYKKFENYDIPYPEIKIRAMTSRWGSCQPGKAVITLNSHLMEFPRECIEYVVLHEFAHFIHPNHSKQFWELVTELMPDWKERRKKLDR